MTDSLPNVSRESTSYLEVPARPIEVIAAEALADVNHSIRRLTEWGVGIEPSSRLHQAREILEHAIKTRELVPKHRGDDLGLRALELAFDYGAIAETLPKAVIANMKRELRDSLLGPINPPANRRGSLQLQSQAVMRAAFVRAGEMPRHPTHSPKKGKSSPDLIFDNGTVSYAIETKRPQVRKNIIPQFDRGSDQVKDYGLPGGVLIDATDALREVPGPELLGEVHRVALELYDRVFVTGEGYRPSMSHLMLIGVLARVAWHSDDGEQSTMVQVHSASTIGVFATTENNLAHHRARWLRNTLGDGLEQLDRTLLERARAD
jgi:hypothetical protein